MTIQIPENEVAYLRLRLQQTRWPPPVESSGWAAGTDADYLRALADYSGITPFANPMPTDLSPAEIECQKKVAAWA